MACYHPFQAWQREDGLVVFAERGKIQRSLTLACGQCIGCRLERSRQWAVRCMHEAQLHERNCFITLTYSVSPVSLVYRDFQLFMKRLRRVVGAVRFYVAGEYGSEFNRPHFHACLFGYDFSDKVYLSRSPSGFKLYRSALLEGLWTSGFSSVGAVSFESAAYVARYIVAKRTGFKAAAYYEFVDEDGVVCHRVPEFNRMSLKPGIGAMWLDKFRCDVFPHGKVVVNGVEANAPRYYEKLFERFDPFGSEALEFAKYLRGVAGFADNSDLRLVVKERVKAAQLGMLTRKL